MMGSTFIAYTLENVTAQPAWTMPPYEQMVCSCAGGTRSIAVGKMTRCDHIPSSNFIIQRGPVGTLIIVDSGADICSYLLRVGECGAEYHAAPLSFLPESLCVIPFATCTVTGPDAYLYSSSGGILTVMWMGTSLYITITIYGKPGSLTQTANAMRVGHESSARLYCQAIADPNKDAHRQSCDPIRSLPENAPEISKCIEAHEIGAVHGYGPSKVDAFSTGYEEDLLTEAIREADIQIDQSCMPEDRSSPLACCVADAVDVLESARTLPIL
ncbi:UL4 protein [Gallid alphaherpesvirus 3]|uniref:UL4 protein n=2 Tax=Gallid alphaherpesvirus 3 TaxID=35250 RepID=Q782U2_9ALPH|nr:nuclear protein UL4 [Gallid alphaherpesvirus 3]YP_010795597.1 UL4-like protein [Gallid alphaherpesvirus 3]BAA82898.1 UL4 product homolog [Marek's disease virus serotype 2 MDV2]AEI00206.1 UL4-like protein [Gallid alphaherpesvirus 3]QEY02267.1 UL4-like protein [Gallid alphaherpesvirus 3]BAB16512.1 UL4 protein [Gallid alphaherpesvirus 3]